MSTGGVVIAGIDMTQIPEELIARTRQGDPVAAAALADLAERQLLVAPAPTRPQRGGEPAWRTELRAQRDSALRELAQLVGADLSLEQCAAWLIRRITTYRPLPSDASGSVERRALNRVATSGLRVPGKRQLRRILVEKI
jgi:hypothetical protein